MRWRWFKIDWSKPLTNGIAWRSIDEYMRWMMRMHAWHTEQRLLADLRAQGVDIDELVASFDLASIQKPIKTVSSRFQFGNWNREAWDHYQAMS